MTSQALVRFLSVVERELGAARAELILSAHAAPDDVISAPMQNGFRIDVLLPEGRDRDKAAQRLVTLIESFAGILAEAALPPLRESAPTTATSLEDVLDLLVHRAKAESAWVVDDSTPEIWGASFRYAQLNMNFAVAHAALLRRLDTLSLPLRTLLAEPSPRDRLTQLGVSPTELAELEKKLLRYREEPYPEGAQERVVRALGALRDGVDDAKAPLFSRRFAGIYTLVLVYEGHVSELHAEAGLLRALPVIEKLVLSLPPRDPMPAGAKVARLRRLRRV